MTDKESVTADKSNGPTGPTARRRQLGIRLRALRETAGLTVEQAGSAAGMSSANVSRYERARGGVRWNQVDQLCRVYQATDDERRALIDLAKRSKVVDGWWVPYAGRLPSPMRLLLAIEDEASRINQYTAGVVPGLLQTLEYASAIKETPGSELPPDDVTDYLSMRMKRQQILARPTPPTLDVIMDESVLHRVVGSPGTMTDQLDHLLQRGRDPHIDIRVLPFAAGAYGAALSSFLIYGGQDPSLDVIFIETSAGSLFLEEPEAQAQYARASDFLRREALDPDASAQLIAEARKMHMHNK
ncbi:helix-turn-helix transcriptional regulator [Streptomyces sp. RFCAC02]|uniref:helix-turn-helix domain-containing protein n=1 Tax=Streptomyces sp. RFCAC02 TaxID=2499143 RepID=UPI00101FB596|nr:helix-turn-helix transcriptional regulator [Streptomyces sp. RFCAC02]